ncbi:MAG: sulfotransferase [Gammaproteobacteria bacterium]|nr:sulfotransferase [Gammaproteobacteria bacterium]
MPPPDTDSYASNPRIGRAQHDLELMSTAQPHAHRTRLLDAEEAGDCSAIFNRCLMSTQVLTHYAVPDYARWFWAQPLNESYHWYRDELQLLQTNVLGSWVLRSPFHQWGVEALQEVFPDAILVQTHREPLESLAAGASRCESRRRIHSDEVDPLVCGRDVADEASRYARRFGQWREQHGAAVIDVGFRELIANPLDTLASIYRASGRKLGMHARMRMQSWLRSNPQYAESGQRRYDARRYGLDATAVQPHMTEYCERYRELF